MLSRPPRRFASSIVVVGLSPHEQSLGCVLERVSIGRVVSFVVEAIAEDGGDLVVEILEAEHE